MVCIARLLSILASFGAFARNLDQSEHDRKLGIPSSRAIKMKIVSSNFGRYIVPWQTCKLCCWGVENCIKAGNLQAWTADKSGWGCTDKVYNWIIRRVPRSNEGPNNYLVTLQNEGSSFFLTSDHGKLWNNRAKAGAWEEWIMEWTGNENEYYLKSKFFNKYLSAQPDKSLEANRDVALAWEKFKFVDPNVNFC